MDTWDELDDEEDSDRAAEEASLALMAYILSNFKIKSESGLGSDKDNNVVLLLEI